MKELKRIHIMIPALAVIFLLIAVGSANAIDCPVPGNATITTSCTVANDYTVAAGEYGYIIGAPGVVIDGQGHTITGAATNAVCINAIESDPCIISGIYNDGYDNVEIKNLKITKFCTGIAIRYANNNIIDNCEIFDNGFDTKFGNKNMVTHGVHAHNIEAGTTSTPAITIVNSDIYDNEGTGCGCGDGGNGIFIYAGGNDIQREYANISNNELYGNAKAGFWTKMKLSYSDIKNNHVYMNGGGSGITDTVTGGIILRCKMTGNNFIENNNASDNSGIGIYIGGDYNIASNNNKANSNSGEGIYLGRSDGSSYNQIINNEVCWNDKSGIKISGDTTGNTLNDNTICENGQVDGRDIWDWSNAATGNNNWCDTAYQYNDNGAAICDFSCNIDGSDLVVTDKYESWKTGSTYNITYTVTNTGTLPADSSITSIKIDGSEVATDSVGGLASGASYTKTLGPYSLSGTTDTILVCADRNNAVAEINENNNCFENVFGGPDYIITDFHEQWLDYSKKTYNLVYTVENVGDANAPNQCKTDFKEINGEWNGCIDPVNVPALSIGGTMTHTVGPFIMGEPDDWLEAWVNFEHDFEENVIDDLHGNRARFTLDYPGPCLGCGDVDCSGGIDMIDIGAVFDSTTSGGQLVCDWAADVDCSGGIDMIDVGAVFDSTTSGGQLDCCKGCELW